MAEVARKVRKRIACVLRALASKLDPAPLTQQLKVTIAADDTAFRAAMQRSQEELEARYFLRSRS